MFKLWKHNYTQSRSSFLLTYFGKLGNEVYELYDHWSHKVKIVFIWELKPFLAPFTISTLCGGCIACNDFICNLLLKALHFTDSPHTITEKRCRFWEFGWHSDLSHGRNIGGGSGNSKGLETARRRRLLKNGWFGQNGTTRRTVAWSCSIFEVSYLIK